VVVLFGAAGDLSCRKLLSGWSWMPWRAITRCTRPQRGSSGCGKCPGRFSMRRCRYVLTREDPGCRTPSIDSLRRTPGGCRCGRLSQAPREVLAQGLRR